MNLTCVSRVFFRLSLENFEGTTSFPSSLKQIKVCVCGLYVKEHTYSMSVVTERRLMTPQGCIVSSENSCNLSHYHPLTVHLAE